MGGRSRLSRLSRLPASALGGHISHLNMENCQHCCRLQGSSVKYSDFRCDPVKLSLGSNRFGSQNKQTGTQQIFQREQNLKEIKKLLLDYQQIEWDKERLIVTFGFRGTQLQCLYTFCINLNIIKHVQCGLELSDFYFISRSLLIIILTEQ